MNTFARVLFAVLVVSSVVYVNGDGWFIESDYSGTLQTSSPTSSRSLFSSLLTPFADTACTTPSWLYISSVLADRNQTTDCFPATQGITFKQSSEQHHNKNNNNRHKHKQKHEQLFIFV